MADRLAIYGGALRLLGSAQIASLTEDHPARHALDSAWRDTGDFLLAKGLWNFAIRASELSNDEDVTPLFDYDKAFRKPDDWVRTVGLGEVAGFGNGFEDFEDEANYWYANADPLYVRYISNDDAYGWNVGAWRQPFAKTFSAYLAYECGLPISNDRGNRNDLFSLYKGLLKEAKTLDAVDERVRTQPSGRLTRSRGGRRGYRGPLGAIR